MSEERKQLWSSGGGTQSCCIAVMIANGELQKPDLCLIADTGYEASSTWEYMDKYITPMLADVGVDLIRVKASEYATVGLYGGKEKDTLLIPAFTDFTGEMSKLKLYCSSEWKRSVIRRYANEVLPKQQWNTWIGFTMDEANRCKQETGKWQDIYPLIEKRMTRADAIKKVEDFGLPTPPRSSCWMCPNRRPDEWLELKKTKDWVKVVSFDKAIRQRDETVYLTNDCKPIDEVNFNESQEDMFTRKCDSGMCFI